MAYNYGPLGYLRLSDIHKALEAIYEAENEEEIVQILLEMYRAGSLRTTTTPLKQEWTTEAAHKYAQWIKHE